MIIIDRADSGLAFLLKYENVAWFQDGEVRILDRRIYPVKIEFVICKTHVEVAKAITDMVTQSAGPYTAAAMGMALAAFEAKDKKESELLEFMEKAGYTLSHARPTTAKKMEEVTNSCLSVMHKAIKENKNICDEIFNHALLRINNNYINISKTAAYLAKKIPRNGTIMTQCFGESVVGLTLKACREMGNEIKVICPETRPYFQGARLTASVAADMDFDVTVITDNMPGYVLKHKNVDLFTSAADVITMDGYIVNKIGTFQIAVMANYWNIPYFVTGNPDIQHSNIESVKIEERDPNLVMDAMGTRTTLEKVKGYYPAFDITPPNLCDGVVTDKGIFPPYDLQSYFLH